MAYESPTSDDLALLLGVSSIDEDRADLIIGMAEDACRGVVATLPEGAGSVVLAAAARVFGNPQAVSQETLGPYAVGRAVGLTKQERNQLRRLGGGNGGAFTIDPTAADAGPDLVWAQRSFDGSTDPTSVPPFYDFGPIP